MEVRAKKALGQHFLTDQSVAKRIVGALGGSEAEANGNGIASGVAGEKTDSAGGRDKVLEIGPGMGVLSQYLLEREDIDLVMIEIDVESVDYLVSHFDKAEGRIIQGDYLKLDVGKLFDGPYRVIGNFPYNISSQIFFHILDFKDKVVCCSGMLQKEVAERIAAKPGSKTYGILSVLLQAWYDIEYLFTVHEHVFNPPPKVKSGVIRLVRNSATSLGCDERLFKTVVKTSFGMRRKTLRNSVRGLINGTPDILENPIFNKRPEQLSVEQFVELTNMIASCNKQ